MRSRPQWWNVSSVGLVTLGLTVVAWLMGAKPVSIRDRAAPYASALMAFQGVTIVDVAEGRLLPDQTVVIRDRRVQAVGASASIQVPAGAQVINAQGKYLIPGLWDMHFHTYGRPPQPFYNLLIANGVTGIRDPSSYYPIDTLRRWREEIATARRIGPRQLVSEGMLEHITTPAIARHAIDSFYLAGNELVKMHDSRLSRENFFALAAEARRLGASLEGHLPNAVSIVEASDSGIRILDHLLLFAYHKGLRGTCDGDSATVEKCSMLASHLRRNGTWIVVGPRPTFSFKIRSHLPYRGDSTEPKADPAHKAPRWLPQTLGMLSRAGVPLLPGTDVDGKGTYPAGLPPSLVHEELIAFVESGMTPAAALRSATLEPAKYLRGTDSLGTVAPGKLADLVLLDANPLEGIANTTRIRAVVANGRYFDRAALDKLLAEVMQEAAEIDRKASDGR